MTWIAPEVLNASKPLAATVNVSMKACLVELHVHLPASVTEQAYVLQPNLRDTHVHAAKCAEKISSAATTSAKSQTLVGMASVSKVIVPPAHKTARSKNVSTTEHATPKWEKTATTAETARATAHFAPPIVTAPIHADASHSFVATALVNLANVQHVPRTVQLMTVATTESATC